MTEDEARAANKAQIDQILALPIGSAERNAAIRAVSEAALLSVASDSFAPSAARAQAARTLAEMAGALKPKAADSGKPLSEMTPEEIDARIAALSGTDPV